MPYVPPHLRPGYVAKAAPAATKTRKAEFASNRDYMASNVATSPTEKYKPASHSRKPKKGALKATRRLTPNAAAPQRPGTVAPKFRTALREQHKSRAQKKSKSKRMARSATARRRHRPSKKVRG